MAAESNTRPNIAELLEELSEAGDQAPLELAEAILALREEAVEPLRAILRDKYNWEEAELPAGWMVVHAALLLGKIGVSAAIPELIGCLHYLDHTWVLERLPTIFANIGPSAIEPLKQYLSESRREHDIWFRAVRAAESLGTIAFKYPEYQEEIITFLNQVLDAAQPPMDEDDYFHDYLGAVLVALGSPSSQPIIERALEKKIVRTECLLSVCPVSIVGGKHLIFSTQPPDEETEIRHWAEHDLLTFYYLEEIIGRQRQWQEIEAITGPHQPVQPQEQV
ncbi:MAG: hypothetical protein AB1489_07780 [Acidobacteriota bacterium]